MGRKNKMRRERRSFGPSRMTKARYILSMILVVMFVLLGGTARAEQANSDSEKGGDSGEVIHPEHGSLAEVGKKLSDPTSNVWALFTEFDLSFSSGDINQGAANPGFRMIFQPIMPFPLYGTGDDAWRFITRPIIPVFFSQPIPTGFNENNNLAGLGDIQLPMLVSPAAEHWILALGPTWLFPTATHDVLGKQQWGVGPAGVLGYKTKEWTGGIFPQWTFGIGGWNDNKTPTVNNLNMLYFFFYNLPNAWQVGTNPSITYDNNGTPGNRWNVPIGITVSKTTQIDGVPVKFQIGIEYSVIKQSTYGQQAMIKFNIIPVIKSLVQNPIFGGM